MERERDGKPVPAQTRERILDAALAEFGAKGYSGSRTAGIAARAGVNQQLISYYFGGKQGLLDELRQRWAATEAEAAPETATFAESVKVYVDATLNRPDWARLVIWRALGDDPGDSGAFDAAQRAKLGDAVDRLRRRQLTGEIADDVDPEFVLLLAYLLAFAPVAMPQLVRTVFEADEPLSQRYRQWCVAQLLTLIHADRTKDANR